MEREFLTKYFIIYVQSGVLPGTAEFTQLGSSSLAIVSWSGV